jgi:hypothetical protein
MIANDHHGIIMASLSAPDDNEAVGSSQLTPCGSQPSPALGPLMCGSLSPLRAMAADPLNITAMR